MENKSLDFKGIYSECLQMMYAFRGLKSSTQEHFVSKNLAAIIAKREKARELREGAKGDRVIFNALDMLEDVLSGIIYEMRNDLGMQSEDAATEERSENL